MADQVDIRIRLRDAAQAAAGLKNVRKEIAGLGADARSTSRQARAMGGALDVATSTAAKGLGFLGRQARWGALGVAGLGAAGTKWGLSFNAQLESGRLRLGLFTDDVDMLQRAISGVDQASQFNLAPLTDVVALLGNAGRVSGKLPRDLQAIANAAAASGKGEMALQGIGLALSQIQAKGRLSQEEINQLNEAGAPGAQKIIQKAFKLTEKQVQNLGGAGLDAGKAIDALTNAWTSGKMAAAAKRQTQGLAGQWDLFVGNAQKGAGALTAGLAEDLKRDVLPAANRAAAGITAIFSDDRLAPEEKLRRARRIISRELGPVWDDLAEGIDKADIPGHLGDAIRAAVPALANAAAAIAPDVAKAFVDAWMNSGPWVQIGTLLALRQKTGGFGRNKLKGAGGAAGVSDAVGTMHVTAGTVHVTGALGSGSGTSLLGPDGKPIASDKKTPATKGPSRAGKLLMKAPLAGDIALLGAAGVELGEGLEDKARKTDVGRKIFSVLDWTPDLSGGSRGRTGGGNPDPLNPGSAFKPIIENHVTVKLGDQVVAKRVSLENERARARRGG